ncbi:meiotic W68 [Lasioglossum baleicum]|uniref:meiotic W68 n=1 Tax=Lasioglossum baleicum TaxID=434251 RepID=UPI003FCE2606
MPRIRNNLNRGCFVFTNSDTRSLEEKSIDFPVEDNLAFREQLIARIEDVVSTMTEQLCSGRLPSVSCSSSQSYSSLGTQKIEDSKIEFESQEDFDRIVEEKDQNDKKTVIDFARSRGKEKFALTMTVMAAAHRLLITNTTITRRSLYYDLKSGNTLNLAPEQRHVDLAVNQAAKILNCAPWELNLLPTSKGLAAGELTLTVIDNRIIDCSVPGGALVPHIASNLISVRTRAEMVLIVEKDSVFQKLLEEDCTRMMNCILVTGKGYPDVATRMLVKLLAEKMALPVYALVDADPFGVDIMCVYRFGSASLSNQEASLACPNVRWLGVHPSELVALGVNTIPLTEYDLSKLNAIEGRPYMTETFLRELRIMRTGKAEIENVSSFSRKFLSVTYLPCKIKGSDYI